MDFKVVTGKDRICVVYVERWRPELRLFCFAVWGICLPITAEIWGQRLEVACRVLRHHLELFTGTSEYNFLLCLVIMY